MTYLCNLHGCPNQTTPVPHTLSRSPSPPLFPILCDSESVVVAAAAAAAAAGTSDSHPEAAAAAAAAAAVVVVAAAGTSDSHPESAAAAAAAVAAAGRSDSLPPRTTFSGNPCCGRRVC